MIGEHRRELLQVEGVPLGRFAHTVDDGRRRLRPEQVLRDASGILRRERGKRRGDRARLAGRPGGPLFEELGPREAQEEHGTVNALDDRIGQVEHRRLRPVHVFEHYDERPLGGEDLEQAPHRPGGVGRERLADTKDLREAVAHGRPVGLRGQSLAERRRDRLGVSTWSPGRLREQLDERRERDAVAVGRRLSDEDRRPFADRLREGRGQARLAHTGRSEHGHEHARVVLDRVLQRLAKHGQVAVASD